MAAIQSAKYMWSLETSVAFRGENIQWGSSWDKSYPLFLFCCWAFAFRFLRFIFYFFEGFDKFYRYLPSSVCYVILKYEVSFSHNIFKCSESGFVFSTLFHTVCYRRSGARIKYFNALKFRYLNLKHFPFVPIIK